MSATDASRADAHRRYLATRSFGSLDGLRGLSILGVLWHHTTTGIPWLTVTFRGFLGVDLFFVISGFLITTLLLRERRATGGVSLRAFYVRRFLRIFPPYYGLLLALTVLVVLVPGLHAAAGIRRDLPFAYLYVSNMVPMASLLAITWSLSTEEQFYLVVPALHKLGPRLFPRVILPLAYVLVILPPFGLFPQLPLPSFFRETTFGPILLGVGLAHLMDHPGGYRWTSRVLGWRWAPAAALGLVVLACSIPRPDISGWPRLAVHATLLLLVASCVVREDHILQPVLRFWPLRRLGVVSYGVYLYHLVVYWGVDRILRAFSHPEVVTFVALWLASWGVAELSYRAFESRFLRLKARFAPDRARRPAPEGAASGAAGAV